MGHMYQREDNYVGKRVERLVIERKKREDGVTISRKI